MLPGLEQLIVTCAPQVAPTTMMAIVRVESGGKPYVINVNGDQKLQRQPRDAEEATQWANWLVSRGYSVDMGLAQINSANLHRLGLSPAQLFDPCINLKAGAQILTSNYLGAVQRYGSGQTALHAAISAYNTGNHQSGFANGYVAKVAGAATPLSVTTYSAPPTMEAKASLSQPVLRPNTSPRTLSTHNRVYRVEPASPGTPKVMWVRR